MSGYEKELEEVYGEAMMELAARHNISGGQNNVQYVANMNFDNDCMDEDIVQDYAQQMRDNNREHHDFNDNGIQIGLDDYDADFGTNVKEIHAGTESITTHEIVSRKKEKRIEEQLRKDCKKRIEKKLAYFKKQVKKKEAELSAR